MRFKHIEKVSLVIALTLFILSVIIFSSPQTSSQKKSDKVESELFSSLKKSGKNYFVFDKDISIMPSDFIFLYGKEDETVKPYEINRLLVPSRETIEIETSIGKIEGTTRQDVIFEKNWHSQPGGFSIRKGRETLQVKFSDVTNLRGRLLMSVDATLEALNDKNYAISFYQRIGGKDPDEYSSKRLKWINPTTEENQSEYDLFTPPIIYIHDGELTTRLPEKEVEEEKLEPFGFSLLEVIKAEYPLRLKSWVGETPYFEDLAADELGTGKVIRNRIEVGKPYKRVNERKPGQQSLEICDSNDSEKLFTVQYFAVQQYRNPETGGLKPVGRAMIQDHSIGGKPFEINSLMKDVYAGNFSFKFSASLPGLPPKEFILDSSKPFETFEYEGRKYLVSDIDLEEKKLRVTKQDPRIEEDSYQTFSF